MSARPSGANGVLDAVSGRVGSFAPGIIDGNGFVPGRRTVAGGANREPAHLRKCAAPAALGRNCRG
jgi:hypothetical protein